MEGGGADLTAREAAGDAVGTVLGAGEYEDGVEGGVAEEVGEERGLEAGGDLVHELRHGLGGIGAATDLDGLGRVLELVGEALDLAREGGGEHEGLALFRQRLHDAADLRQEAHVEHAVGLVEHEILKAGEVAMTLTHEVDKTAGGGDDEVHGGAERLDLRALADAAEDGGDLERQIFRVNADVFLDLHDELAGGGDDEHPGAAAAGGVLGEGKQGEDREDKGGGLAGASLGDADEVMAGEDLGNGLDLDGGGLGISSLLDCLEDIRAEIERGKWHRGGNLAAGCGVSHDSFGGGAPERISPVPCPARLKNAAAPRRCAAGPPRGRGPR